MSYSLSFKASNKAAAKQMAADKMAEVAVQQPAHVRDQAAAVANAHAMIDLLADDDSKDVSVTMSGSISGHWEGNDVTRVTGGNANCYASLAERT